MSLTDSIEISSLSDSRAVNINEEGNSVTGTGQLSTRTVFSSRGFRVLALVVAVGAGVLVATTPASAGHLTSVKEFNPAEGINPAAHSVTTHNGKVITGITFVSAKDAPKLRRQEAASARAHPNASAINVYFHCLSKWTYITFGGTNTWWRAYHGDPQGHIFGNGDRSPYDYWNEEFLPCWYTDWPEAQDWAFLENADGNWVSTTYITSQLEATIPQSADHLAQEPQLTQNAMFQLCNYDGNWRYMTYNDSAPIFRDTVGAGVYFKNYGLLDGNALLKTDESIEVLYAGYQSDGCIFSQT
jgi:hypothetical protein